MSHISTHLQVKTSLKPVASAQMQMAIDLLQANRARLRQMVEQAAQENPLLDIEMEISASGSGSLEIGIQDPQDLDFSKDHFEWMEELNEDFHHHFDETYSSVEIKSDKIWGEKREDPLHCHAHILQGQEWLEQELLELCDNPLLRKEALWLASFTNEQGLLEKTLFELSQEYAKDYELLEQAKKVLQELEPKGYGSESLQEALKIQLEAKGHTGCLCHTLVCRHWEDLTHRRWQTLSKQTHASLESIEYEVIHHLKGLHTHFELEETSYGEDLVSLDLIIEFEGGKPNVKLLDMPSSWLKLQTQYINEAGTDQETKAYFKKKKMECAWLIKALAEREKNLILVTKAIALWQKKYLNSQGPLKPLVLKDIAQACQIHESTVARACQDKLAQTPIGVLSLKSLFCSKVMTEEGVSHSSEAICEKIQTWIEQEDSHHPLSDEELVQKLKSHSMNCARRTVSKYRMRLGIPASHQRKMP